MKKLNNSKRAFFIPETIQSSEVDCGPACLKSLLSGFGINASYARLREACQTQLDGTSIDKIEEIAIRLGLDAEQILIPADHLLINEAEVLPAIVVTLTPEGATHFIVIWRLLGPLVEIMDPRSGRHWVTRSDLQQRLYSLALSVEPSAWREIAGSQSFIQPLRARLKQLGIELRKVNELVKRGLNDDTWQTLGYLDAVTRMVTQLVQEKAISKGDEAYRVICTLLRRAMEEGLEAIIPNPFRSVQPHFTEHDNLSVSGTVILSIRGRRQSGADLNDLTPELKQALKEKPIHPIKQLFQLLPESKIKLSLFVALIIGLASLAMFEGLLIRSFLDIANELKRYEQRLGFLAIFLGFFVVTTLIDIPLQRELLRLGRNVELRLRASFLSQLGKISWRYLQSYPMSDLGQRNHTLHLVHNATNLISQIIRLTATLIFVAIGLTWLDPEAVMLTLLVILLIVGVPLILQPLNNNYDLRFRTHSGTLTRFYLDALLGIMPVRAHAAQQKISIEHESLLTEWRRTGVSLLRTNLAISGLQALFALALAAALIWHYSHKGDQYGGLLLFAYWAIGLSFMGQALAQSFRQYPSYRNVLLRLFEPMRAPKDQVLEDLDQTNKRTNSVPRSAVAITAKGLTVSAGGNILLNDINLDISAGTHVAIVGASGAGKSSLIGALLGWHPIASGDIQIDGIPLHPAALRRDSVWVDPSLYIWNDTLLNNVIYGSKDPSVLNEAIIKSDLSSLMTRLSHGLQSTLGEGGKLVSGGEGQRVRLARTFMHTDAKLVLLDEAFRGLDKETRTKFLSRARDTWHAATLIYVTHDINEALRFPRVIVMDKGRIVEDGDPYVFSLQHDSHFYRLLEKEERLKQNLWSNPIWQRWELQREQIVINS